MSNHLAAFGAIFLSVKIIELEQWFSISLLPPVSLITLIKGPGSHWHRHKKPILAKKGRSKSLSNMLFHFQYTVENIQNGLFYAVPLPISGTSGVTGVQISFFSSPGKELLDSIIFRSPLGSDLYQLSR